MNSQNYNPPWLMYAIKYDRVNLKDLPQGAKLLSHENGISLTWRGYDGFVYKRSTSFLIQNEIYCYQKMFPTGYVPYVEMYDRYTICIEDLGKTEKVTNKRKFMQQKLSLKLALASNGIKHGDLTKWAFIVKDNFPYIIDFAESRLYNDPRPDKRPEGDDYWIERTFEELCNS